MIIINFAPNSKTFLIFFDVISEINSDTNNNQNKNNNDIPQLPNNININNTSSNYYGHKLINKKRN